MMRTTTRTPLTVFGVQMYFPSLLVIFPLSSHHISKVLLHQMIKIHTTGANPGSSDLRLVSPLPLPGADDHGDGGHEYPDHGD